MVIEDTPALERLLVVDQEGPTRINVISALAVVGYPSVKYYYFQVRHSPYTSLSWYQHYFTFWRCMFICHPAMLHLNSRHNEGLGTRICRPQPGPSYQLPEMLSVPEEFVYQGDVHFLLNVNHKGVQFVTPFSMFTMTMYYDFWSFFWTISVHTCPPPYWLLDPYGYNQ